MIKIPLFGRLGVGKYALVDDADAALLNGFKFYVGTSNGGYPTSSFDKNTSKYLHRLMHHFILPKQEGVEVDHINRNKLDNRRCNLRYVTRSQNIRNQGLRKDNKSGHTGIWYNPSKRKWRLIIRIENVLYCIGGFHSLEEAVEIKTWFLECTKP